MSERIGVANLDEIILKNKEIHEETRIKTLMIRTNCNSMQISSSSQLAMQILKHHGLIQLPIDNRYWSGAIFVKDGKRIPVLNTALPRANQYFTAWHEIYHLFYDDVSFNHVIGSEASIEERKAEYFASQMLLGNLLHYYLELPEMDFLAKVFHCMDTFEAPFKAVMIALYESAEQSGNTGLMEKIKQHFDKSFEDLPKMFRDLGLDDSLVKPSYVINVNALQAKINERIKQNPELNYNHDNAQFLNNVLKELNLLMRSQNA